MSGKRKIVVGGKEVVVPTETTGKEIKKIAEIPDNRQLIEQGKDGSNRIDDKQKIKVSPDSAFDDVPKLKFG